MSDHPLERLARTLTPARVFAPRKGTGLATGDWLALRADHAAARDAVFESLDLARDFGQERIERHRLFEVPSQAPTRAEYLLHPDLGRLLHPAGRAQIDSLCPKGADLQIFLGDGLSAAALIRQGPPLLDRLTEMAQAEGLTVGRPFFVRQARVGLLNEVGLLLNPEVAVLLIGERPGLSTAESLSAYLAYRPQPQDTDAKRNLVSNIHERGVPIEEAARRIFGLVLSIRESGQSGVTVKEDGKFLRLDQGNNRALTDK
jgi:ethanolamine ammonia-lyase small subunit